MVKSIVEAKNSMAIEEWELVRWLKKPDEESGVMGGANTQL